MEISLSFSNAAVNNVMMIEALMYGVMDNANIVNLLSDPPENVSIMFSMPLLLNTAVSIEHLYWNR